MKFGGTSVGSAKSILSVKKIVEAADEPVIVVVSALGGITDKLIDTSRKAAAGDASYEDGFREIVFRHVEMIREAFPAGPQQMELQHKVGELLNELKDIFQGIYLIKDLSQKTSDTIVSYGERISSIIAAQLTGAEWFDSRQFIKTEKKFSKHVLDKELTNRLVRSTFANLPKRSLVPGFIATDVTTGDVTNLGRGGSDYTAAIIAAALDADSLEIWTDVDGFMTADPRVISTAYTINELSYVEATELCNFGAKVVYPPTIYPVCHKNIPILIKNTFNPEGEGTIIKQEVSDPQSKPIKGISSINDTTLITVQGLGMVGVIGVNYRIFKALAKNGISVFLVSQASSENSTSIGVRNADADLACAVLTEEFAKENAAKAPTVSLYVTSALMQLFMLMVYFSGNAWNTMLSITSVMVLPAYFASAMYLWKLCEDHEYPTGFYIRRSTALLSAVFGTLYALWLIYAAGLEYLLMALIFMAAGIPVFVYARRQNVPGEPVFAAEEKTAAWILGGAALFAVYAMAVGIVSA